MEGVEMQIPLADAIQQLRDELRKAVLEGKDQDIVFTPTGIDLELGINFTVEAKAEGGFKILALLDLSADANASRESQHKVRLSLTVADRHDKPIKVRSDKLPGGT
jgi:hypothetical protein